MPPILVLSYLTDKRIAAQILVIGKLNGRNILVFRGCVIDIILPSKQLLIQS